MFGAKLADVNPMLLNREPRLELDWLDMVTVVPIQPDVPYNGGYSSTLTIFSCYSN